MIDMAKIELDKSNIGWVFEYIKLGNMRLLDYGFIGYIFIYSL